MNFSQTKGPQPTAVEESQLDVLRSVLMMNIATAKLRGILNSDLPLPDGMNSRVLQNTIDTMDRFTRESKRTIGKTNTYLDRLPHLEFVENASMVCDMLFRIGVEQNQAIHEEFLGLIIDTLDVVFYAQSHRKAMHFPKYRALAQVMIDEIKADVNRTSNQVQFVQGSLWFKNSPAIDEPKIK